MLGGTVLVCNSQTLPQCMSSHILTFLVIRNRKMCGKIDNFGFFWGIISINFSHYKINFQFYGIKARCDRRLSVGVADVHLRGVGVWGMD